MSELSDYIGIGNINQTVVFFDFKHLGICESFPHSDHKAECDRWSINIRYKGKTISDEYYTGIGLRKNKRPQTPSIADVMYSLLSDASCILDRTFIEFCDDLDYSSDSISHLKIYLKCQETYMKLRDMFGMELLKELMQKEH